MKQFVEVKAAYDAIDAAIQMEIAEAAADGNAAQVKRWTEWKELNDYAYYVVLFAQFERIAKAKFDEARDKRIANPDWNRRRAWDCDAFRDADRVSFSTRLAVVLDRTLPEYGRVLRYYADRNHVAHGGLINPIPSIEVLALDLAAVIRQLRT